MKKTFIMFSLFALSGLNSYSQETLQTVTDRGNTTSNRISLNPVYQFGSRITAYGAGSGYFDIYNNSNSSISLALKRSDGASVLEVDGHSMNSYFGGNVGIGTTTPSSALDVAGLIQISGINSVLPPSDLSYGLFGYAGVGLGIFSGATVPNQGIGFWTNLNNVKLEVVRISNNGNVGIGTVTPTEKLAVNGKIRAQEIKVEASPWPDYVFTKDYQLPSLQQTEQHIKEKGHLPGIPSAVEVKANGIDLGEMNAKLLQKIEELTLHLIKQEKDQQLNLDRQNSLIKKLIRRLESLERKSGQ